MLQLSALPSEYCPPCIAHAHCLAKREKRLDFHVPKRPWCLLPKRSSDAGCSVEACGAILTTTRTYGVLRFQFCPFVSTSHCRGFDQISCLPFGGDRRKSTDVSSEVTDIDLPSSDTPVSWSVSRSFGIPT